MKSRSVLSRKAASKVIKKVRDRRLLLIMVVVVAIVGSVLIFSTRAATSATPAEAESGQVAGNASAQTGDSATVSGGSFVLFGQGGGGNPPPPPPGGSVYTAATIAQYDGKNGNPCYVAVDGIVYDVENNSKWVNGEHVPSGGAAHCGADMSQVILGSPHGKTVLDSLPQVGTFQS